MRLEVEIPFPLALNIFLEKIKPSQILLNRPRIWQTLTITHASYPIRQDGWGVWPHLYVALVLVSSKMLKKSAKLQVDDVDKDVLENYTSKGSGEHF